MHSGLKITALLIYVFSCCGFRPAFGDALACSELKNSRPKIANRPIVLTGVVKLRGKKIDKINAYAFKKNKFVRVDIQIDERNQRGDFVLERGLPFTANSDDGIYDENDDFVFMAHSLGADFQKSEILAYLKSEYSVEILRVCDKGSMIGVLAIVSGQEEGMRKLDSTPVRFEKYKNTITSDYYRYQFNPRHAAVMGALFVREEGGKEKKIIKGSSFQMAVNPAWFLPYIVLDHHDFSSSVESWRQGPIRTIVAVGVKYVGLFSMLDLHLFSELVFYENSFSIPTVIEFVFSPKTFLSRGSGLNFGLNFEKPVDWKIETELPKLPAGADQIEEYYGGKAIDSGPLTARLVSHDNIIQIGVRVDKEAAKLVPSPMVFDRSDLRSNKASNDWPGLAAVDADIAVFLDISNVSAETYDFGLDLFLQKNDKNLILSDPGDYRFHWH